MECRSGCGACCIAISISSPIPGRPEGKKAGERCIHLSCTKECRIWNHPDRPEVCKDFMADPQVCGDSFEEAMVNLSKLEEY
ncbi:MAG: YkgJ family cysteine cluster protein [Bacteroidetes bacterium]|nr:YkgJ family cysteine cluster protein [Bacteroidota bacterium]